MKNAGYCRAVPAREYCNTTFFNSWFGKLYRLLLSPPRNPKMRCTQTTPLNARIDYFFHFLTVFCGKPTGFREKPVIFTSENNDRIWQSWGSEKGGRTYRGTSFARIEIGSLVRKQTRSIPATSQTTTPPAIGLCNVATYDLIDSRRRSVNYSGSIPVFSDFVPVKIWG